jgi:hypothetical protein
MADKCIGWAFDDSHWLGEQELGDLRIFVSEEGAGPFGVPVSTAVLGLTSPTANIDMLPWRCRLSGLR